MLPDYLTTVTSWVRDQLQHWIANPAPTPAFPPPPSLGALALLEEATLPSFVRACPVALHYRRWLATLDWAHFPERRALDGNGLGWRGPQPQANAPFVAALLIKVERQLPHLPALRRFLVEHPALTWLLGFPLVASTSQVCGFDVEASLPSHQHFTRRLRQLPNETLHFLLTNTVQLIQAELPPAVHFGDAISLDTKHIIAWVKENNPKASLYGGRFHKHKPPKGDRDCRLGFKALGNQGKTTAAAEQTSADAASLDRSTPTTEAAPARTVRVGDYYWGYASGVVATKVADWGEFVLAELTQPFDQSEVSYFFPLMTQTEQRLGRRPRFGALDAGFDAHYVYDYFHPQDPSQPGFAAVPLRHQTLRHFDPAGLPLCEAGLAMPLKSVYTDSTHLISHQRGRYACPLLFPQATGEICPIAHKNWEKGGCLTTMSTSIGARLRYQLDRHSDAYQQLYKQRTATERIKVRS